MANNVDWLTPAGIGAATAVVIQLCTLLLQRSKIQVDDGAALRKDLIEERHKLVEDVARLSDRFSKMEEINHSLRKANIELEQKLALAEVEKARYQSEIDGLKKELSDVKTRFESQGHP